MTSFGGKAHTVQWLLYVFLRQLFHSLNCRGTATTQKRDTGNETEILHSWRLLLPYS